METLKFKTNVKCSGCVATITSFLNNLKGLENWSVDLSDPQKILTAEVSGISSGEIMAALQKAGYKAEKL